jgi:hypothetical protein
MITKLGLLVPDLAPSQLAYFLTRRVNQELSGRTDLDAVCFAKRIAKPCLVPHFAVMGRVDLWGFDGAAVATDLESAHALLKCPTVPKKFFYVWDLEWVRIKGRAAYEDLAAVYQHPELTVVTRGPDHRRVVKNAWGRDSLISADFDLSPFLAR